MTVPQWADPYSHIELANALRDASECFEQGNEKGFYLASLLVAAIAVNNRNCFGPHGGPESHWDIRQSWWLMGTTVALLLVKQQAAKLTPASAEAHALIVPHRPNKADDPTGFVVENSQQSWVVLDFLPCYVHVRSYSYSEN